MKNVFPHVVITVRSSDDQRFVESLLLPEVFKIIDVYAEVKTKPSNTFGFLKNSIMIIASRFLNPGAKLFHDFQYIYFSGVRPNTVHLRTGKPPNVVGGAGGTDDGPGGGGSTGLRIEEQLLDLMDDSGGDIVLSPHVHTHQTETLKVLVAISHRRTRSVRRMLRDYSVLFQLSAM